MSGTSSGDTKLTDKPIRTDPFGVRTNRALEDLLSKSSFLRVAASILLLLLTVAGFVGLWYVWFKIIPIMWSWSIETWWQTIIGLFGILLVGEVSLLLPGLPGYGVYWVVGISAQVQQKEIKESMEKVSEPLEQIERDLERKDKSGLIALVRYSREQLKAYYEIGLNQTQRSFRYSVVAMWIGFLVIVSGIVISVFPTENVFDIQLVRTEMTTLILAGGGIMEIISALFLWVYRSSIVQLTYFYNRQIHTHSILLCDRIASSMEQPDEAKQIIVQKVLERIWTIERPGEPGSGGIAQLLSGKK